MRGHLMALMLSGLVTKTFQQPINISKDIFSKLDAQSNSLTNYSITTYETLIEVSDWCALSYCVTNLITLDVTNTSPSITPTKYLSSSNDCSTLDFCREGKGISIIEVFNPSSITEANKTTWSTAASLSGSGLIAIDHPNEKIVVAFRGSTTVQDLVTDMESEMVYYNGPLQCSRNSSLLQFSSTISCDGCMVHEGIQQTVNSLIPLLVPKIAEISSYFPDFELILLGHSLGGSIATLFGTEVMCSEELSSIKKIKVYNVAGLRIGNEGLTEFIDEIFQTQSNLRSIVENGDINEPVDALYTRIVHKDDLIPLLPAYPTQISNGEVPYADSGGIEFFINKIKLPHFKNITELLDSDSHENDLIRDEITSLELNEAIVSFKNLTGDLKDLALDNEFVYNHVNYFLPLYGCNSSTSIVNLILDIEDVIG